MINLTPRCSCIICRNNQSAKGIHSHFITAHTKEGNDRIKNTSKHSSAKATTTRKNKNFILNLEKWKIYYSNPTKCKHCNQDLDWFKRKNTFCDASCAANFTNKLRPVGHSSRIKNNKNRSDKLKNFYKDISKIKIDTKKQKFSKVSFCQICNKSIPYKLIKTCSSKCYKQLLSIKASTRMTHPQNGKTILYNGIKLGSSYELKVAQSLDEYNITWTKPKPLLYTDPNNKMRRYFADFYLPDFNIYLDPKNDFLINNTNPETGFNDCEKIKRAEIYNNVKIIILNKNQLNWNTIRLLICREGGT